MREDLLKLELIKKWVKLIQIDIELDSKPKRLPRIGVVCDSKC